MMRPNGVEKQVRPSGWQPGANTIAYYPLTTDFNDASGNGYNLTNSGGSITTAGGVACAYYNGSSYSLTTAPSLGTTRTISCRWRPASTSRGMGIVVTGSDQYSPTNIFGTQQANGGELLGAGWQTTGQNISSGVTASINAWYHIVITISNGTEGKIYINGQLKNTVTISPTLTTGNNIGIGAKSAPTYSEKAIGYVSEAIIENKARTAQEISDYYNQTKGNYGL